MAKDNDDGIYKADSSLACDSRGKKQDSGNKPFLTCFFSEWSTYLTCIAKKRPKIASVFIWKIDTKAILEQDFIKKINLSYEKMFIQKTRIKDGTDYQWENSSHTTNFIQNVRKRFHAVHKFHMQLFSPSNSVMPQSSKNKVTIKACWNNPVLVTQIGTTLKASMRQWLLTSKYQ